MVWGFNYKHHFSILAVVICITTLLFTLLSFETLYAAAVDYGLNDISNAGVSNSEDKTPNKNGIKDPISPIRSHLAPVNEADLGHAPDQSGEAGFNSTKKIIEIVAIKTDESFEDLLNDNEYLLVLFTASWCGMSKRAIGQIYEMVEYFEKYRDFLAEHPSRLFYSKKLLIGLINVPEFPNLTKRLNVLDYPSIKLVKKEDNQKLKIIDFYGNIYHKKVLSWIIQQITRTENNPKSQLIQLSTVDNIRFFLEISGYSVIYLHDFESKTKYNTTEFLLVIDICKIYDDVIFGEANYNELKKSLPADEERLDKGEVQPGLNITEITQDSENKSKMLLFNSGKHVKTIHGPFNEEALILNVIDYYKQENIIFLNKDTIGNLIDNGGPILLLIFNGNSENYAEELNKESSIIYQFYSILQRVISIRNEKANKAGIYLEERPLFVVSGNEGPINRRFMDFLHIDDDLLPSIIMIDDLNVSPPKKFHLDLPKIYLSNLENNSSIGPGINTSNDKNAEMLSIGKPNESNWIVLNNHTSINFSPNIISDFIDEVKSGMVNVTYHSQVAPTKQNGPVYILVGNTFKDTVHDKNKDVLVLFYTPWCGHCKTFDPIYNEVANIVTSKTNVLVAKIDMSANFIPDDQIGGKIFRFPTIKLFKKKDKLNPIDFDGEREANSILDFVWIHTARDEL